MKAPTCILASSVVMSVLVFAVAPSHAQTSTAPPGSAPSTLSVQRFSSVDTDGNGQISREELDRLGDERLVFADIDTDTDSAISRAEWDRFDLQFKQADADGDGFISPTELDDLGDDTMSFANIDSDKNSSISRVEWDEYNRLVKQDAESEESE